MRQQEAMKLARHIEREEPLFVVQQIGWRERDRAWALKVYDTITERQAVIMDARTWPRLRAVARTQQRQLLHRVFDEAKSPDCVLPRVRRHEPLHMMS
jgi:hypothetical protein